MAKLNHEIGFECRGQRPWTALYGGDDCVRASALARNAPRCLDSPSGVCRWHGCHCDSHSCPAKPEVAPATRRIQPGSAESSWEQLDEVPGWSTPTAADSSFQPQCADDELSWRSGEVFFGQHHHREAGCGGTKQRQQCLDNDQRGKPSWFSCDTARTEVTEVKGLDGRNAVSLDEDSFYNQCTSTEFCHDDESCTQCCHADHLQLKSWTPGADERLSQPLGSMALPVHTTVTGTWLGTRSTPFYQSTVLKEPVYSGLVPSCGNDPASSSASHARAGLEPTVDDGFHLTAQRRRDATLWTSTADTSLVSSPLLFGSRGFPPHSTLALERTGAGVGEEEPAEVITFDGHPFIRTASRSAASEQPVEPSDFTEVGLRLARQRVIKQSPEGSSAAQTSSVPAAAAAEQPVESVDSTEARMWFTRQRVSKQWNSGIGPEGGHDQQPRLNLDAAVTAATSGAHATRVAVYLTVVPGCGLEVVVAETPEHKSVSTQTTAAPVATPRARKMAAEAATSPLNEWEHLMDPGPLPTIVAAPRWTAGAVRVDDEEMAASKCKSALPLQLRSTAAAANSATALTLCNEQGVTGVKYKIQHGDEVGTAWSPSGTFDTAAAVGAAGSPGNSAFEFGRNGEVSVGADWLRLGPPMSEKVRLGKVHPAADWLRLGPAVVEKVQPMRNSWESLLDTVLLAGAGPLRTSLGPAAVESAG